jgi:hypothetical protein
VNYSTVYPVAEDNYQTPYTKDRNNYVTPKYSKTYSVTYSNGNYQLSKKERNKYPENNPIPLRSLTILQDRIYIRWITFVNLSSKLLI